ncbi:unnamed protein product [Symbiodinium natans]|uniref:Uncharacterized protein n=1 Tax=Symbiodinium natans TaxID=878477 RepID=A0A812JT45_9DINO|nr:unnamed protein product [Symbiodinium natans]
MASSSFQQLFLRPRATRAASSVRGHLRLVHSSLLLRGGARTPLLPLEPESFWRSTLPSQSLLRRLTRGEVQQEGPRRLRRESEEDVWGQLTTRGADEAFSVGRRLESWLAEQNAADDADTEDDAGEVKQELQTTVITSPTQRAMLTARAVVSALLPRSQRADAANVRLRLATRALRVDAEDAEALTADPDDEHAKQDAGFMEGDGHREKVESARETKRPNPLEDAALDLAELLGQDPQAFEGARGNP